MTRHRLRLASQSLRTLQQADQARYHARLTHILGHTLATMRDGITSVHDASGKVAAWPVIAPPRFAFQDADPTALLTAPDPRGPQDPSASETSEGTEGPGTEAWEAWHTLVSLVLDRLTLPRLDATRTAPGSEALPTPTPDPHARGPLARKATLIAHLHRQARAGLPHMGSLHADDFRYHTDLPSSIPAGGAVICAMMDTSGSMGPWEKDLAKTLLFWMVHFLRRHYPAIHTCFIAHDVRARVLPETPFFQHSNGGGTMTSSALRLAHTVLDTQFPATQYHRYGIYLGDGGNLHSDNARAREAATTLIQHLTLLMVGELLDTDRKPSVFYHTLPSGVRKAVLRSYDDVVPALQTFFHP